MPIRRSRISLIKHARNGKTQPSTRSLRHNSSISSTKPKLNDAKQLGKVTNISWEKDIDDFVVSSDSDSLKGLNDSWKSLASLNQKIPDEKLEKPSESRNSDLNWTMPYGLKNSPETKMKVQQKTTVSQIRKASAQNSLDDSDMPRTCHIELGASNNNIGSSEPNKMMEHAGDNNLLSVELISTEMDRLKETALMMSEMNKRLSGENDAMMEIMRSVQPRTKDLMEQVRQERREATEVRSRVMHTTKEFCKLKAEVNILREELVKEKEKYSNLKSQTVQLRSQYVIKVSKLQQLKRNTRKFLYRYRQFKQEHLNCSEERDALRTKLIEVVGKFEKLKSIASQFQEGGNGMATKLQELQVENSSLLDEKVRLQQRVRESDGLSMRFEAETTEMAKHFEGDIARLKMVLQDKESALARVESQHVSKCQENALLRKDVKRISDEQAMLKKILSTKESELNATKERLVIQDENVGRLQDAYLQLSMRMSDEAYNPLTSCTVNQGINNNVNATECVTMSDDGVSKSLLDKVGHICNDVVNQTSFVRRIDPDPQAKDGVTGGVKDKLSSPKKNESPEKSTMRRLLKPSAIIEPKIFVNPRRVSDSHYQPSIQSINGKVSAQTQTEEQFHLCRLKSTEKGKEGTQTIRSLQKPKFMKEKDPNRGKNNNSSNGNSKIWRLCRAQERRFQNMFPSHCAIVSKKEPVPIKVKSTPSKKGKFVFGKYDQVFKTIRSQEKSIERLKSQLDTACDSSPFDSFTSDEDISNTLTLL